MKIITINLPEKYLSAIKVLNDFGFYASRSEAIRVALKDFLTDELKFYEELDEESLSFLLKNRSTKRN